MDFSSALPTFIITLREGVEAALVVGIVLAYLRKAQQSHLNPWVYGGIVAGLVVSAIVGVLFGWLIPALGTANQKYAPVVEPLLEAVFSLAAIGMLSWMLIWMTRQARLLKTQVEAAIGDTLKGDNRAGWGVFGLIFFAVLREGFETVLFIAAKFQQGVIPALGAIAGIVTAVAIGFLLFRFGVKINLRQFFTMMGIFLLLIVAGLVVSSLGHFDTALSALAQIDRKSAGLCIYYERFTKVHSCVLGPLVWNTSKVLPERDFPGIILHTLFGYEDTFYLVQAIGYVAFLAIVGGIYLRNLTGWGAKQNRTVESTVRS
ncbi:FTR1 family iron permease [Leptolyngbya sp. FACHB-36]|uniref:FTR1 family iron permease n=1 Tax=Leptolyngbya sp. FACHB-36 TaxID=2692808 RepID=UPI0016812EB5|nr:FTR1 family protein [Leptolyngbya sp. FACHB-36]MBD2021704.1 FTR1 family iron permease [Leptolyngbya sp. FACHB-36]